MGLADLLASISEHGFSESLDLQKFTLRPQGGSYNAADITIVDSVSVDAGTDPGDDATVYLFCTSSGARVYLVVPESAHVDPEKARFINAVLEAHRHEKC